MAARAHAYIYGVQRSFVSFRRTRYSAPEEGLPDLALESPDLYLGSSECLHQAQGVL